ncbi:DUF4906 domain-containing protein [uncultured Bacteroides sp.]|uniref:DUF4906 domain-containing protein n=1 Tax=uncultured Bacteroides sp. TaxID=162156 RepID=UPI0025CC7EE6|nr:DUF4906 domain-containing protein [uncultured Bacteroides sp.]
MMCLGLASARAEGGYTAFSASLCPQVSTRDVTDLTPDALYNLEIRQYNSAGTHLAGSTFANATIGTTLDVALQASEDCQLVIVARGDGNTVKTELGTRTLQKVQEEITVDSKVLNQIDPVNQTSMNKMPYVLHLKHVKVVKDGASGKYIIQSMDGAYDARLRLKRLATRLTMTWTYAVSDFDIRQILIQSVPLAYAVVDAPDEQDGTYPSLVQQFTTIEVPSEGNSGSYSCWIPANVRGSSAASTSEVLRTKANAPQGSAFINFVAVNKTDAKKKLDYRVYLGGRESSDFNVLGNTNYNYTVNFKHAGIPTDDGRVTYIDPIPASENNNNLLPTANCFMIAPGGAFCFDPFVFQSNGTSITNDKLVSWCSAGGIKSVKLLWQTKENGDVGDPTMGIANSNDDHTNIVDVKRTDGATITAVPATGAGQCLIYCRTAANTSGGSGVIAAYDGENGTGNILWSWHVWVTDYHPDATGTETVLAPEEKRKLKLVPVSSTDGTVAAIMMDRNLGAYEGAFNAIPKDILTMSRNNGFHFQKGRKDPFPSSYTTQKLPSVYQFTLSADAPPKHIMNRYKPDGFHAIVPLSIGSGATSLQKAYQVPISIANNNATTWCSDAQLPVWGVIKTIHDPCPAGWRMPQKSELNILVNRNTAVIPGSAQDDGGALLKYDNTEGKFYMRFTGYPPNIAQLNSVGTIGYMSASESAMIFRISGDSKPYIGSMRDYDAHTTRCVQEKME